MYRPHDGLVHYKGTKLHPRFGIDHQLLPSVDFLALWVGHVLLRYEITIRCYGALSTTFRKRVGWIESPPVKDPPREAFAPLPSASATERAEGQHIPPPPANPNVPQDEESDFTKKSRRNWAKLIAKVYFNDPCLCRSCGKEMKIIAAIASPGQDDVIEKVLRHMKIWPSAATASRFPPPPGVRRSPARVSPTVEAGAKSPRPSPWEARSAEVPRRRPVSRGADRPRAKFRGIRGRPALGRRVLR